MSFFRDLFSTRRRAPRVAVHWMVDLAIPHTDPQHWIGLFATDLSAQGIRLQGLEPERGPCADETATARNAAPTAPTRRRVALGPG